MGRGGAQGGRGAWEGRAHRARTLLYAEMERLRVALRATDGPDLKSCKCVT